MPKNKSNGKSSNGNGKNGNGKSNGKSNGNGNGKNRKQVQDNKNYRPMNNSVTSLSGSDYVATVSIAKNLTLTKDHVRATIPVTPNIGSQTRIERLSNLWERYRFKKFNISDNNANISDPTAFLRACMSQAGAQQFNFLQNKTIPIAVRKGGEMYYTGSVGSTGQNERFNYQGKIYVVQITEPVSMDGTPISSESIDCGQLYIDWTMDVQTPQMNPESMVANIEKGSALLAPPTLDFAQEDTIIAGNLELFSPTWLSVTDMNMTANPGLGVDVTLFATNVDHPTKRYDLATIKAPLGAGFSQDTYMEELPRGKYQISVHSAFAGVISEQINVKFVSRGKAPVFVLPQA